MYSLSKARTLGARVAVLAGTAVCAAGFMVGGAGTADAAGCGAAHLDKIGKQDVVVQSCPKGKKVIYTVTCGPSGRKVTTTVSAKFTANESRVTKVNCGGVGSWATGVEWKYA
ncbi:hypothetical protein [Brachybacterium kimchii]|uniref:Secreted protein n=1 Tax=Brachybacterium kimchii TaxID=2942909 RepID=A0ABY4N3C8_9MICO|nr:hypothetical protein [Brachybacterium kimchii]UQN28267.1 hypothetical protein M4486_11465 [Brachybacterium kimchii]